MKSIEEFPAENLPLRGKRPLFNADTEAALLRWGQVQPGALPWLIKRSVAYWDREKNAALLSGPEMEKLSRNCEATAALDLLRWRIEAVDDRLAVEHLKRGLAA